jgi:hypothetical protein
MVLEISVVYHLLVDVVLVIIGEMLILKIFRTSDFLSLETVVLIPMTRKLTVTSGLEVIVIWHV